MRTHDQGWIVEPAENLGAAMVLLTGLSLAFAGCGGSSSGAGDGGPTGFDGMRGADGTAKADAGTVRIDAGGDTTVPSPTLTIVTPVGGKITDDAGNIDCGTKCTHGGYTPGARVTLTAQPNSGYVLGAWSGGGCSGNKSTCVVTLNGDVTITATFKAAFLLTLKILDTNACSGNYASSVATSASDGAACSITNTTASIPGHTCAWYVPNGGLLSLMVTAMGQTVFDGRALDCGSDATEAGNCQPGTSGTCTCTFTMTAPRTVVVSVCHP